MSPKIERCAMTIQWNKGINAVAYPRPKDLLGHQKQAVATSLPHGQLNLSI